MFFHHTKGHGDIAETWICPFCGIDIWERDRENIKQEIQDYYERV
jgi:hypothetical protein